MSDYGVAGRGGPAPPNTLTTAAQLFEDNYVDEQVMLRETILRRCLTHGNAHADDLRHLPIQKANGIGIAFNSLKQFGMIRATKHRASAWPATHGRKSYEYVLTERGRTVAEVLR